MAFDILHWNADPTRLPARMLIDYLRNFCLDNRLVEPGGLVLGEESIDLRRIRTPSYFISTKDDHIAPWKATYPATQLFAGPVTFVLGGSGHIAGIINPPAKRNTVIGLRAIMRPILMLGLRLPSGRRAPGGPTGRDGWRGIAEKRSRPGGWAVTHSRPCPMLPGHFVLER